MSTTRKKYTTDWLTDNLDLWKRVIPKDAKKGLEVGTYEGRAAVWLLRNLKQLQLTVVDPFDVAYYAPYEDRFDSNVAEFGDRVNKLVGFSQDILPTLGNESYDLIYVDGDHSYEAAHFDISACWDLLSRGGIIILDDYNSKRRHGDKDWFGVKQAADEFFKMCDDHLIVSAETDYQLAVKKV